ncbi:thioredoxin family protein [Lunatimonas salinarum]|uniref:thioredoxin family protein n=1 Tax=Lunatimonas salinarum TaxID=1774590 RepID=UPI001FD83A74|nr:thioredoxin family protein [Lunatimonas salinarum]
MKSVLMTLMVLVLSRYVPAQDYWLDFEQLEDSLRANPKPVFLYFQTDWCSYCRKMEAEVFTKEIISTELSEHYYAVKFDAEYPEDVLFDGKRFSNRNLKKSRTPFHDIALLFSGEQKAFAPPLIILLDERFFIRKKINSYLDSKSLYTLLSSHR